MKALKLILVDDNEPFRNALKQLLAKKFNAEIIGVASCGKEFLGLQNIYQADIILMDIMMPDMDGITLTKKSIWTNSSLKFIAITMHYDKVYLKTLIESGFRGCIFKSNLFNEIELALNTVMEGHLYFPKDILLEV
jgi:two-component system, NarL family, response regulator NreC